MTSRTRKTLAQKQLAMLLRNKPRRLRSLSKEDRERIRRRIAAVILVSRHHYTAEQLAAKFGLNVASVEYWLNKGMPIV